MTKETTNFLVSGTYELGQEIQKLVQEGWTLIEGSPSDHGWQKEVRMERDVEDDSTENKPKRGRKAAVSEAE